jgi:hypothetical protein
MATHGGDPEVFIAGPTLPFVRQAGQRCLEFAEIFSGIPAIYTEFVKPFSGSGGGWAFGSPAPRAHRSNCGRARLIDEIGDRITAAGICGRPPRDGVGRVVRERQGWFSSSNRSHVAERRAA